jgi:hypothetical protein
MKGLGQGMREFKKGLESDDPPRTEEKDQETRIRAEIEDEVRRRVEAERRLRG